tara:strand:- start:324 stop:455 length:132 start_codon:yes stop_codon:yes gene_type:complete
MEGPPFLHFKVQREKKVNFGKNYRFLEKLENPAHTANGPLPES